LTTVALDKQTFKLMSGQHNYHTSHGVSWNWGKNVVKSY